MKIAIVCDMTPCCLVDVYQRFRRKIRDSSFYKNKLVPCARIYGGIYHNALISISLFFYVSGFLRSKCLVSTEGGS
jgi:hypothetical protein